MYILNKTLEVHIPAAIITASLAKEKNIFENAVENVLIIFGNLIKIFLSILKQNILIFSLNRRIICSFFGICCDILLSQKNQSYTSFYKIEGSK